MSLGRNKRLRYSFKLKILQKACNTMKVVLTKPTSVEIGD